ncbi:MAG: hypothetical protein IT561_00975 [Alphaproteobacteria bacterium]|nr:hypothetical protein [Alphaproteobacteria bacterium]
MTVLPRALVGQLLERLDAERQRVVLDGFDERGGEWAGYRAARRRGTGEAEAQVLERTIADIGIAEPGQPLAADLVVTLTAALRRAPDQAAAIVDAMLVDHPRLAVVIAATALRLVPAERKAILAVARRHKPFSVHPFILTILLAFVAQVLWDGEAEAAPILAEVVPHEPPAGTRRPGRRPAVVAATARGADRPIGFAATAAPVLAAAVLAAGEASAVGADAAPELPPATGDVVAAAPGPAIETYVAELVRADPPVPAAADTFSGGSGGSDDVAAAADGPAGVEVAADAGASAADARPMSAASAAAPADAAPPPPAAVPSDQTASAEAGAAAGDAAALEAFDRRPHDDIPVLAEAGDEDAPATPRPGSADPAIVAEDAPADGAIGPVPGAGVASASSEAPPVAGPLAAEAPPRPAPPAEDSFAALGAGTSLPGETLAATAAAAVAMPEQGAAADLTAQGELSAGDVAVAGHVAAAVLAEDAVLAVAADVDASLGDIVDLAVAADVGLLAGGPAAHAAVAVEVGAGALAAEIATDLSLGGDGSLPSLGLDAGLSADAPLSAAAAARVDLLASGAVAATEVVAGADAGPLSADADVAFAIRDEEPLSLSASSALSLGDATDVGVSVEVADGQLAASVDIAGLASLDVATEGGLAAALDLLATSSPVAEEEASPADPIVVPVPSFVESLLGAAADDPPAAMPAAALPADPPPIALPSPVHSVLYGLGGLFG